MKEFFKKKWVKRIIIVAIIAMVFVWLNNFSKVPITYRTTEVESGDVTVIVSGTGAIAATESRKEISKVTARVEEIYFKEGDIVKAGDVIAKLDSTDYEVTVNSQKSSLQQAQISKNNADRLVNNLKIISNGDGFINNLNISEGSYVVSNTKVCDIMVPNKYEIDLQFLASSANKIGIGDSARIFLLDSYSYIDGNVTYVSKEKQVLESGSNVINVTVMVDNPNYVLGGLAANATITTKDGATLISFADSTFKEARMTQVLSGATGTVTKLLVKNGSEIKAGDVIAELENVDLNANAQSSAISVQNISEQLAYSQSKLDDYAISASLDGTITAQNIKVGDWVSSGTLISTVSNMEEFEFLVAVDELDISKISLDSEVLVTLDALPETLDNPIKGKIAKLPLEGVAAGGVTDYYVTISVPYVEGMRIAMNASADIIVTEIKNTLRIPVECVSKENGKYFVEVVNGETVEKREINVGVQNTSYYEIVSGLTKGEQVIVPQQTISLF